ncbi:copper amine oxidase N-terminal domain-containing protein [Defluviitalea phaphyphila]|uniref:copper amine oxidase N-terminal domain-containing protein n=1 Tax=Defluviitalea phaphyphila TaxID=1473580 RepID=UPI0007300CE2|nr:copper amine oxidase N-terminal domain-containing protein [Defluviitalea phaphyphila]
MNINPKKRFIALTTTALLSLSTTTAIHAAPVTKTLKAVFNDIKVSYNGEVKSSDKEPFIVDGTTYVPIRMVGELVGKVVQWDSANKQILITDSSSSSDDSAKVSQLTAQLAQKDIEIIRLKQEKAALESQLEALEEEYEEYESYDEDYDDIDEALEELEDKLNDEYEEYEDIEFDIYLDGDEDDIEITIKTNLDDYYDEWYDLDEDDIEDFIEDICNDIWDWDIFEDADIEGTIYDKDSKENLVEFESDSDQDLDFDFYSIVDLSDLEDDLDKYYDDYFDDITLSVEIDGDIDSIVYEVRIDYDEYEKEWEDLSDSEIKSFMADIYDDIEDVLPYADIEGYVYTSSNKTKLAEYWISSSGSSRFERYDY